MRKLPKGLQYSVLSRKNPMEKMYFMGSLREERDFLWEKTSSFRYVRSQLRHET
jgi:hypothetical protein